jgi:putative addiction module component (TIGR02574 family)
MYVPIHVLDLTACFGYDLTMSSSMAEISQKALCLPVDERAALIDQLFDSIDEDLSPQRRHEIERAWAEESERRIDAVDGGELKTIDGKAALANLRASIRK